MTADSFYAGVDVGSLTVKAAILNGSNQVISSSLLPTEPDSVKAALKALSAAIDPISVRIQDLKAIVATGYGRENLPIRTRDITEISCHAKGVWMFYPGVRTVLDMGGQDLKVMHCDEQGQVIRFAMNDKCAAGTGRFVERIAKTLGLPLEQVGEASLHPVKGPVTVNSYCTVFAEEEILRMARRGVPPQDILAGGFDALVRRMVSMLKRIGGVVGEFSVTGGVAKNIGIVKRLEKALDTRVALAPEPQLVGAVGAAWFARDIAQNNRQVLDISGGSHNGGTTQEATCCQPGAGEVREG